MNSRGAMVDNPVEHQTFPGDASELPPVRNSGRRARFLALIRAALALSATVLLASCGGESSGEETGQERTARPPIESAEDTPAVNGAANGRYTPAAETSGSLQAVESTRVEAASSVLRDSNRNAYDLLEALRVLELGADDEIDETALALLGRLGAQGARAVLPIRDALLDSRELGDIPPALRSALLDVLLGMNEPGVELAALELLAGSPEPFEIWRVGEFLELIQPGRYTDGIRLAAEEALITADPQTFVPPEFFQLLGLVGNSETALVLAEVPLEQQAYASLALAALPDGGGVPILEGEARVFETGRDTLEGRLALELLAQEAPGSPQAATALVDLAKNGVVPRNLWPYLLDLVAGRWTLSMSEPPPELIVGSHTYFGTASNQVIWRVAPHPDDEPDGFEVERESLLYRLQLYMPDDIAWDP
jgi:hypothetical protein